MTRSLEEESVGAEAPVDARAPVPPSRRDRLQERVGRLSDRRRRLLERAEEERRRHESVSVAFEVADRDSDAGGGIIAGALAYRLFVWLLPLALVGVAGLGVASDAASESPQETAKRLGLSGLVSSSIASAAQGQARWYALLVGIPILVYVTRSLLRALIVAHRLLWGDARADAPRPTVVATLRLLVLLLAFSLVSAVASAIRSSAPVPGVLVTLVSVLPYAGLWLVITLRLPHRGADWRSLVPGALLGGTGMELFHLFIAYVLAPYAVAKQGTYGALGAAAALLFGLFLISRLVVLAAVLNATLWERRARAG